MAHMSRGEVCKRKMKGISLRKKEKRAELARMDPEEREEMLQKRFAPTSLKEKANIILWDYEKNQLPITKYPFCAQLLRDYLKEDLSETETEKIKKTIVKMGC